MLAGAPEVAVEDPVVPGVHLADPDAAPVADLPSQGKRTVVDLQGSRVITVELGEDGEVAIGRRYAGQVAYLLTDGSRVLIARLRRAVVALELGHYPGEVEHLADAGVGSLGL